MPDHSSDATAPVTGRVESPDGHDIGPQDDSAVENTRRYSDEKVVQQQRRRQRRTDWRLGGSSVRRWRESLLATSLVSLGIGVLAGTLVASLWQSPWAAASATALIWLGMLVPVVRAFSLSIPAGMLRLRAIDLLYAVGLAGILRVTQGWTQTGLGGSAALPSYPLIDGHLPTGWWFTDAVSVIAIAPVIEELFFRCVLLVVIYCLLRRVAGRGIAAFVAVMLSTGAFVVVHALSAELTAASVISLTLLGLVCGAMVVLTGRIWGAVLVHVLFNASFVALALIGTFLG